MRLSSESYKTKMATIDFKKIKFEFLNFLRNSDILTLTQRGVATTTDNGTFAADLTHTIAVTNIKNIRSIVIGGTTLSYGKDYTVDLFFLDTTYKTKITFTVAQTGVYVITYDFGTGDKIWDDFPRNDLTVSSYPRIGFDIISGTTREMGVGAMHTLSEVIISVVVYAGTKNEIEETLYNIRNVILSAKKDFYYIKFITPGDIGPMIMNPNPSQKIMQRNYDFYTRLKTEAVAF